ESSPGPLGQRRTRKTILPAQTRRRSARCAGCTPIQTSTSHRLIRVHLVRGSSHGLSSWPADSFATALVFRHSETTFEVEGRVAGTAGPSAATGGGDAVKPGGGGDAVKPGGGGDAVKPGGGESGAAEPAGGAGRESPPLEMELSACFLGPPNWTFSPTTIESIWASSLIRSPGICRTGPEIELRN